MARDVRACSENMNRRPYQWNTFTYSGQLSSRISMESSSGSPLLRSSSSSSISLSHSMACTRCRMTRKSLASRSTVYVVGSSLCSRYISCFSESLRYEPRAPGSRTYLRSAHVSVIRSSHESTYAFDSRLSRSRSRINSSSASMARTAASLLDSESEGGGTGRPTGGEDPSKWSLVRPVDQVEAQSPPPPLGTKEMSHSSPPPLGTEEMSLSSTPPLSPGEEENVRRWRREEIREAAVEEGFAQSEHFVVPLV
jgi:hypothetical protein